MEGRGEIPVVISRRRQIDMDALEAAATTVQERRKKSVLGPMVGFGGAKLSSTTADDDGAYVRFGLDNEENPQSREMSRRKRKPVTVYPGCDCEFQYRDYTWKKFTEYEPSRNGVEVREFYVVNMSGKELFTYAEGAVGSTHVETRFPILCGEIVSSKKLASAGKLKNVFAWVQSSPEDSVASAFDIDDQPLHVRQRQEGSVNGSLTSLPLTVDKHSKVVVFRSFGKSLFIQLMPTIRSEHKLIPGTPLFDKYNRGIRAAVGSMFSEYDYVVNCVPTEFCEIPINKNKQGSDRLRIVCLDRRGFQTNVGKAEKKSHSSSILSLVSIGVDAIVGSSLSGNNNIAIDGGNSLSSATSVGDLHSLSPNEIDLSSENEVIYNGVVNEKLQVTDSFTKDKKNKPPKLVVTIAIDDGGVSVQYIDESECVVFKWVNRDPKTSYSIKPRRFFNAKANVIELNTAARTMKKESTLKRFKSMERLIM